MPPGPNVEPPLTKSRSSGKVAVHIRPFPFFNAKLSHVEAVASTRDGFFSSRRELRFARQQVPTLMRLQWLSHPPAGDDDNERGRVVGIITGTKSSGTCCAAGVRVVESNYFVAGQSTVVVWMWRPIT